MRACIGMYRSMYAYLEALDAEAETAHSASEKSGSATPLPGSGSVTPSKSSNGLGLVSAEMKSSKKSSSSQAAADHPDEDFRSGVYLGMGVVHLILSLLPSKVLPILELFGYKGDRTTALRLLEKAGGWGILKEKLAAAGHSDEMQSGGIVEPGIAKEDEGLRRSLCEHDWSRGFHSLICFTI